MDTSLSEEKQETEIPERSELGPGSTKETSGLYGGRRESQEGQDGVLLAMVSHGDCFHDYESVVYVTHLLKLCPLVACFTERKAV